jgi:hypothetical protein
MLLQLHSQVHPVRVAHLMNLLHHISTHPYCQTAPHLAPHPHTEKPKPSHSLEHKLLVKLAPQEIIDKLALLGLIVDPRRLVLEDQVVVPPPLDCKGCCGGGGGAGCAGRARGLAQRSLEIQEGVTCRDLGFAIDGVLGVGFGVLWGQRMDGETLVVKRCRAGCRSVVVVRGTRDRA